MDKIRQLLEKCGLSKEATTSICESLDSYAAQIKQQYEDEFNTRLTKAKQVCMEEVKAHKTELSRRLQIFLEAKNVAIEEQITRRFANQQAEAVTKLEKIASLVEGIESNGQPCSELKTEVTKLQKLAKGLVEERNLAVQKAKRVTTIAERVLKRNRLLEQTIAEGTQRKTQPQRLDAGRSNGQRKTTQPTITENVDRQRQKPVRKQTMSVPVTPAEIAAQLEEI